jgi:hypothetical protein
MLLADEVGLGKTVVAQGVIQALLKGRRRPLTVIYLCSNAEIAEQNRTKLDPESRKPIGRVTELAIDRPDSAADLLLYSFTPGTSLREGTGLAWERRLMLYLLHRIYDVPVGNKTWREFFRCGAGEERWYRDTTMTALGAQFERKTSVEFQQALAAEWRAAVRHEEPAIPALREMVPVFDVYDGEARTRRNGLISILRGIMQRVALRHLAPDLVILDEVQRFRDVLDEANNSEHIAAELFAKRVPVLILSATPYRALTLGHEVAEGASSHHEDFFRTSRAARNDWTAHWSEENGVCPDRNQARLGPRREPAGRPERPQPRRRVAAGAGGRRVAKCPWSSSCSAAPISRA